MHSSIAIFGISTLIVASAFGGDAAPPAVTPPVTPPMIVESATSSPAMSSTTTSPDKAGATRGWGGGEGFARMVADNPELKGVDFSTPEGQEKVRQAMQVRMRQRMVEAQAAQHAELKKRFAMQDDEWTAIEPLLTKVETLRRQKSISDRTDSFGGRRGMTMTNDTPIDPAAQEVQDAAKALKALLDDAQANANEMTTAVTRLRKAREAFQAVLVKAQEELRSVLTQRQEAILVDRGILE